MALIPTYSPSAAGTGPVFAACAAGDTAPVGDHLVLEVQNADVATHTVTIVTPATLGTGDAYPDKVVVVPIAGEVRIPLIRDYADTTDGLAHITYSATTGMTRIVSLV
jgi:hypothetical protein